MLILVATTATSEVIMDTDVYEPGDLVGIEILIDTSSGSVPSLYTIQVVTPEGSTLLLWVLEVEDDGTSSLEFKLPENSSDGNYTVYITYMDGEGSIVEITTFEVREAIPQPPPDEDPIEDLWYLLTVLAIIGGTLLAMWAIEPTKYILGLITIFLFARIKREAVLDNKTRYAINGIILENPGIHYNAIMREFGLTNGVAAYHLRVMEREDFIRSVRDGKLKRYYPARVKIPKDMRLSPEELREEMLRIITAHPGISQRELIEEMGLTRDTIGYHLRELVKEDELVASRKGKYTVYRTRRLL